LDISGIGVLIVSRWLYTRSIVIDGNFSAEHLKMKQPEEDVALSPGRRYMTEPKRYELHLNTGKEVKQVSTPRIIYYCNLILNYIEITVLQPQSSQLCQYPSGTPYIHRNWCNCMCSSWMFFPQQCCRFSEGREVCGTIVIAYSNLT
jgi:hypothetical protein